MSESNGASDASSPEAVKLITRRESIQDVVDRFESAYSHYRTAPWKQDEPIKSIIATLRSLDLETCDYSEVIAAIGRDWTELECDVCRDEHCDAVIRIGDDIDLNARWQDVCLPCLSRLGKWATQAIEARSGSTAGNASETSPKGEGE